MSGLVVQIGATSLLGAQEVEHLRLEVPRQDRVDFEVVAPLHAAREQLQRRGLDPHAARDGHARVKGRLEHLVQACHEAVAVQHQQLLCAFVGVK